MLLPRTGFWLQWGLGGLFLAFFPLMGFFSSLNRWHCLPSWLGVCSCPAWGWCCSTCHLARGEDVLQTKSTFERLFCFSTSQTLLLDFALCFLFVCDHNNKICTVVMKCLFSHVTQMLCECSFCGVCCPCLPVDTRHSPSCSVLYTTTYTVSGDLTLLVVTDSF